MQCESCKALKLSEEFPELLSTRCDHTPSWCLRCVQIRLAEEVSSQQKLRCPVRGCGLHVTLVEFERLKERLQMLHCPVPAELQARRDNADAIATLNEVSLLSVGIIRVAIMDGRSHEVSVTAGTTLSQLMQKISVVSRVAPGSQLLVHGEHRLDSSSQGPRTLRELKIPFGSQLNLVVLMHAVAGVGAAAVSGSTLTFSLSWTPLQIHGSFTDAGRPKIYQLQGTCTALSRTGKEIEVIGTQNVHGTGIGHSGSSGFENPTQTISVWLSSLGADCYFLFFTLSCRHGLANIVNPAVALSDEHGRTLATYNPDMASLPLPELSGAEGGAIVLCCAKKREVDESWIVAQCGSPSAGYLHFTRCLVDHPRYAPIEKNIKRCMNGPLRHC